MSRLFLRLVVIVASIAAVRGQQAQSTSIANSSTAGNRISAPLRPTATLDSNTTRALAGIASVASAWRTALPVNASSSSSASAAATSSAVASGPPTLDTRIDTTFGILGGLLIVSGLAIGSVGTLHRRSSVCLSGLYAGALVVALLIVHFVDPASPPKSITRGLFLLAALVAGIVSGGFSFLFHQAATLVQASLAGLLLGATLLCVRNDSLIRPVGLRYILLLGLVASFFVLACIPKFTLPVVLVATSLLGSIAVVVGVDCFTTAGLKEFYVYSFGFTELFPKLQGHYRLSSSITIELGVILALFICMMAFQHRFYVLMGRKQELEREQDQERNVRAAKTDDRARRHNEAQVGDWEEKYGNGRPRRVVSESALESFDRKGKRKSWFGFGKSRKHSKGDDESANKSRSKSSLVAPSNATSVDFLPRLEVEFGESQLKSSFGPSRPVLSPIQAAPVVEKEGWDNYLSTRQVAMSPTQAGVAPTRSRSSLGLESLPARSRSSLALVTPPSSMTKTSPRLHDEGDDEDDDDDTPLALSPRRSASTFAGAPRSRPSPPLSTSRPATMFELPASVSRPEPAATLPRSQSRALSIAQQIPSVLLESPSRPVLPRSESQPGTLDKAGRRATLLDLNEPSKFNPYNERERQRTASDDRIVVGDRRKSLNSLATPKKVKEGPKIMDFEDLDAKHRKRLSLLQTTAVENVAAENAKAEFLKKQQAEAASERRKAHERRRSISTDNALSSPRSDVDEFGQIAGGRPKSIASLSGLLSLKRNGSAGDLLLDESRAVEHSPRREPVASPPRPRTERRQSAQSFASTSKRLSQTSLASPPRNVRRHSLTTLLETSFDDAGSEGPAPPLAVEAAAARPETGPRRVSGGVEKVTEWRRSGTLSLLRPPIVQSPRSVPTTPAAVEPPTPTKKGSKKTSWLDY